MYSSSPSCNSRWAQDGSDSEIEPRLDIGYNKAPRLLISSRRGDLSKIDDPQITRRGRIDPLHGLPRDHWIDCSQHLVTFDDFINAAAKQLDIERTLNAETLDNVIEHGFRNNLLQEPNHFLAER